MKATSTFATILLLCFSNVTLSQTYSKNGMVVSASSIASGVGLDILKKGGNAVDASIATAFALAVTHPAAGNIGGGGFMMIMKNDDFVTTIDFREKAPLAATQNMFQDENGYLIKNINHYSAKAIGVPGTVAGLYMAHQKYGLLAWSDLVEPAVKLANEGFDMNWSLYGSAMYFESRKEDFPYMNEFFRNEEGNIIEPRSTFRQPALAESLTRIMDQGQDGFYKGKTAKSIAQWMKKNGGIITKEDLEKYEAVEREPVQGTYKGYTIYSMPPPSSGGATLIQMMNMMELADFETKPFNSTAYVHFLTETMRRAYGDRAKHLGDPDFNPEMPLNEILSKEHAKDQFETINWEKATVSDSTEFGQLIEGGDNTTHLSAMDKNGNAVSLTYTLEYSFGSRLYDKKLGFIFNNEMGDFNPVPGITNSNGQIGTKPNLIQPEKRMLSSMTPTIVAKDGKPYLVIGSPGGRTIINTVFQTVLNVLEFEMSIDDAIESMKIHHQWFPDYIRYEKNKLSPDTKKALEDMGHTMKAYDELGALMGIIYDSEKEVFIGHSDSSRPDGGAMGY